MKRVAGSELNHDNWDQEEEKEERGEFTTANSSVISQRKVIVARRRPTNTSTGVFKAFGGFTQVSNTSFGFNLKANDNASETSYGTKDKHVQALKLLNLKFLECIEKHISENPFCVLTPTLDDYNNNLSLIKKKYPLCASTEVTNINTTETFKLSIPENKEQPSNSSLFNLPEKAESLSKPKFAFPTIETKPFTFGKIEDKSETTTKTDSSTFNTSSIFTKNEESNGAKKSEFLFGIPSNNNDAKVDFTKSLFGGQSSLFGKTDSFSAMPAGTTSTFTSGFSLLPSTAPMTSLFGTDKKSIFPEKETSSKPEEDENEEVYVPPTATVLDVKESDSVFDIKCKLFYQKDKEWKVRGVGNLFIKPINKGKFQLVIRAENSLATIILNVLITEQTPLSANKNNVSVVAITDFLGENKPTSLLLRVKTEANAEELLAAMKKQL